MNKHTPPAPASVVLAPHLMRAGSGFDVDSRVTPIAQLGNVLRRRWRMILCCVLAASLAAAVLGLRMPRIYTAWAQIVIAPPTSQAVSPANDRGGEEAMMTIETQVSTLQSRDLVGRVLSRLIVAPNFPILDFGRDTKVHQLARLISERLERMRTSPWLSTVLDAGWVADLRRFAAPPDPRQRREMIIAELVRNLKVNSEPRSRVVSVRYTALSPELAVLVVNTVIDTYISGQRSSRYEGIRFESERLARELPALQADLQAANAQIRTYRMDHAIPDPGSIDLQEQQAVTLKAAIKGVEAELARLQGKGHNLERSEREPAGDAASGTAPLPIAEEPAPPAAEEEAALTQRLRTLQAQLDGTEAVLRETQPASDHLKELLHLADAKRQVYEDGLLRQQRLLEAQELVSADASILSAAAPPQTPTSASPILFLPPALVAGFLIGGLLAIWRDSLDDSARSERDVSHLFGASWVGFLPSRSVGGRAGGTTPTKGLYAAALRRVFDAAFHSPFSEGSRTVLVTSSLSGEGSALLARDLADVAARLAGSVLLIDLMTLERDERKAHSSRSGGIKESPGTVLDSPIAGMVLRAALDRPGLHILEPAGLDPDGAHRLLRDMPQALHLVRELYERIIILAGPVLETAGARLLAGESDRVLIAIRWGRTRRSVLDNALAILGQIENASNRPSSVGGVLTGVNVKRHLSYRFRDSIEALIRAYGRRVPV